MRNKRADLSLSINAIVILILAITMLGLGLGFIRGMFGKVSTSFEEMVSSEQEPTPATETSPITASKEMIIGKFNDRKPIKFSVYCFNSSGCKNLNITVDCKDKTAVEVSQTSNEKNIDYQKSASFAAVLKLSGQTESTTLCTATVSNNGMSGITKDFFVKIIK